MLCSFFGEKKGIPANLYAFCISGYDTCISISFHNLANCLFTCNWLKLYKLTIHLPACVVNLTPGGIGGTPRQRSAKCQAESISRDLGNFDRGVQHAALSLVVLPVATK